MSFPPSPPPFPSLLSPCPSLNHPHLLHHTSGSISSSSCKGGMEGGRHKDCRATDVLDNFSLLHKKVIFFPLPPNPLSLSTLLGTHSSPLPSPPCLLHRSSCMRSRGKAGREVECFHFLPHTLKPSPFPESPPTSSPSHPRCFSQPCLPASETIRQPASQPTRKSASHPTIEAITSRTLAGTW